MTHEAPLTLRLDAALRDRFVAEADAAMRPAEDVLRDLVQDFVARRQAARAAESDAEIAQALRETEDPATRRIPHREAMSRLQQQRAGLAAVRCSRPVDRLVDQLLDHPNMGRAGRVSGTRELVVPRTPFLIVYRIGEDAILILRPFHGAQDRPTAD